MMGTQPGSPYALDGEGVVLEQWEPNRPDTCHADFQGRLKGDGTLAGSTRRVRFGDSDGDGALDQDCNSASYQGASDTTIGDHPTHSWGYTHCHLVGAATCYDRGAELYDDLVGAVEDPDRSEALSIVASAGNQGRAPVVVRQEAGSRR